MGINYPTQETSATFHGNVSGEDHYYYLTGLKLYKKVDTGTFSLYLTLPITQPNYYNAKPHTLISVAPSGHVAVIMMTTLTGDFGIEAWVYDGLTLKAHTVLETQVAGNTPVSAGDVVDIHLNGDLFYFMWNGFYRSMGTDFSMTRYATINKLSGVVSASTDVYQSATGSNRINGVIYNTIRTEVIIANSALGYYIQLGNTTAWSSSSTATILDDIPPERKTLITQQSGVGGDGNYVLNPSTSVLNVKVSDVTSNNSIMPTVVNFSFPSAFSVLYAAGLHTNIDESELYIFCYGLVGVDHTCRLWSIPTDVALSTARTPTLIYEEVITEVSPLVKAYPDTPRGMLGADNSDIGSPIGIFVDTTGAYMAYDTWIPGSAGGDVDITASLSTVGGRTLSALLGTVETLTIALATSGGRALIGSLSVVSLDKILMIMDLNNAVAGLLIQPQDEHYILELNNGELLTIPMEWFTIRKVLNSQTQTTEVSTVISIPVHFLDLLGNYLNSNLTIKRMSSIGVIDLMTGDLNDWEHSKNSLLLNITSIEVTKTGVVNISDVTYIRNQNAQTTVRLPPYSDVSAGQLIRTKSIEINSIKSVLYVSESNGFLEVS